MKFMLIIREDLTVNHSEDSLKEIIRLHKNWFMELASKGKAIDGNGLPNTGFLVEKNNNEIVAGPIRDLKEGIGGYYIIEAENLDEAVELAKGCPTFNHGDKIEVRPIM